MISEISENIKNMVISIYNKYNIDFDIDKYERIMNIITRAILTDDNNDMVDRVTLYYAGLLYPLNNVSFHSFDNENIRTILNNNNVPKYIDIEKIINIIRNKDSIIYDCVNADDTSPISILEKARWLLRRGIPLYTYQTPYIKSRDKIYNLCVPNNNPPSSFMKYIYHQGIFIGNKIKTKNRYVLDLLNNNKERMIDLCLLYGNQEHITIEDIENWV